jgi:hypothetical protein
MQRIRSAVLALVLLAAGCALRPAHPAVFRITVLDAETGRGIPAVELRTTDGRSFYTDSAGAIALADPVLMDRSAFFQVLSFGYRFEPELLGWPGVALAITPGGSAVLRMQRENVAERLYRVTGAGIYRDSRILGDAVPQPHRAAEAIPAGTDSVFTALYRGELFWVWGDTSVLSAPLGIFRATAATSLLPGRGGLDPAVGVDLRYLRNGTQLRAMVEDAHPVIWLSALRTTRDAGGEERLFATHRKVVERMQTLERGLVEFDDARGVFRVVSAYPAEAPIVPDGHVFRYREDGVAYLQYDMDVRGRDEAEAVRALGAYEAFTPLRPGSRLRDGARALERGADGRLAWAWKRDAPPVPYATWDELVASGDVAPHERPYRLVDIETGETVVPHHGSIQWNEHRRRWIMIRGQLGGASPVGEVYYFEGDTPLGPWAYGRKIITHARTSLGVDGTSVRETYSFYNPMQHPEFDRAGGREIFLEGTLAALFADPAAPRIPAYDYNQLMYALRLDDARLVLPVPVYRVAGDPPRYRTRDALEGGRPAEVAFFAPDRPRAGTVPVREVNAGAGAAPRLVAGALEQPGPVRFHCAPGDPPPATVPLYEAVDARGRFTYTTRRPPRAGAVLCNVWPAPVDFRPVLPTTRIEAPSSADPRVGEASRSPILPSR